MTKTNEALQHADHDEPHAHAVQDGEPAPAQCATEEPEISLAAIAETMPVPSQQAARPPVAKKFKTPRPPTPQQMQEVARRLKKPETDPAEALRAGLMLYLADPILMHVHARDQVKGLVAQAAEGVNIITSMGEHLRVELHGQPVRASNDYAKWTHARLKQVAAHVNACMDRAIAQGERATAETARLTEERQHVEKQLADARQQAVELKAQVAALQAMQREEVLRANTMVASYRDQEIYVVAQLDPETGNPIRYAREELEGERAGTLGSAPTLTRASRYSSWDDANDVRLRIVAARRKTARLGVVGAHMPVIAVMQLALHVKRAEDLA